MSIRIKREQWVSVVKARDFNKCSVKACDAGVKAGDCQQVSYKSCYLDPTLFASICIAYFSFGQKFMNLLHASDLFVPHDELYIVRVHPNDYAAYFDSSMSAFLDAHTLYMPKIELYWVLRPVNIQRAIRQSSNKGSL